MSEAKTGCADWEWTLGERGLAGVDEAGRGPLAGPVYAAAVVLDPGRAVEGLADSKRLSANRRMALEERIKQQALSWAVARAEVHEIDSINILQASLLAMQRAVTALDPAPTLVLIDGNRCPALSMEVRAVVKGDGLVAAISAASILAKEARDREMVALDARFPGYGLAGHKGYPTRTHLQALAELGPSEIHRRSFGPVRRLLG